MVFILSTCGKQVERVKVIYINITLTLLSAFIALKAWKRTIGPCLNTHFNILHLYYLYINNINIHFINNILTFLTYGVWDDAVVYYKCGTVLPKSPEIVSWLWLVRKLSPCRIYIYLFIYLIYKYNKTYKKYVFKRQPGSTSNGILNSLEANLGQDPRYASVKCRLEATNMQKRMGFQQSGRQRMKYEKTNNTT